MYTLVSFGSEQATLYLLIRHFDVHYEKGESTWEGIGAGKLKYTEII